jgi:ribonuclease HII
MALWPEFNAMTRVCGVDEAGRGPLAGPVYAAAVILDPERRIDGLRDSKQLSAKARDALADQIRERSLAWSVAWASVAEIDQLNILGATMLAMRRAVLALPIPPEHAIIDGNRCPVLPMGSSAVVQGDVLIPAISAASIIAKTQRDAYMLELHLRYPQYGFDRHMGYGTRLHIENLGAHGPCPEHRSSFAPVRELLRQIQ